MLRTLLGLVLLAGVGACGPGLKPPNAREVARTTLADVSGDPVAIRKLLEGSVSLGQLQFAGPQCATQFPPGEVEPARFDALASCLAALKLQPSKREDALGDVAVLTYGPGFEVEARVIHIGSRSQLTWIGFASQHQGSLAVPTLAPEAFEALRASGSRVPTFDAATVRAIEADISADDDDKAATAWLKVCLDESGAISQIDSYDPTSYVALEAFRAAANAWTFRPFVHDGKPHAVCSMVRMSYPAAPADHVETLPLPKPPLKNPRPPLTLAQRKFTIAVEGRRIAGSKHIVPDPETKTEISKYHDPRITGTFRLCLDETGSVTQVLPLVSTGFPAYDRDLFAGMNQWRYSPYSLDGEPVPVCTLITFIYTQR